MNGFDRLNFNSNLDTPYFVSSYERNCEIMTQDYASISYDHLRSLYAVHLLSNALLDLIFIALEKLCFFKDLRPDALLKLGLSSRF